MNLMRRVLHIKGMTCTGCEARIENYLKRLDGIIEVNAMFSSSNVYITYNPKRINMEKVIEAIENMGYTVKNKAVGSTAEKTVGKRVDSGRMPVNQIVGIFIIILALYVIIKNTAGFNFIPQIDQSMGYGILFVMGLLTSLHCIAMCGGINLSQSVGYKTDDVPGKKMARLRPGIMYNAGRVVSYTAVGAVVGAVGSAIGFSGAAKGTVAILSGALMVVMGLNMLNIFPWLKRLMPRMPKSLGKIIYAGGGSRGPFYVGLLNGLMPCGPLQSMQIYALGTGSALTGALSMLLFSLGTIPLMLGFSAVSSLLSSRFTHRMMKVSAALVLILGLVMIDRGLNLSGVNFAAFASPASQTTVAEVRGGIQTVTSKVKPGAYEPIVVQKGIPVRWTITAAPSDLNGCNNAVVVPRYGIEKRLVPGDNIIEFTPTEEETIKYTCWMGMISSTISVVDDIGSEDMTKLKEQINEYVPAPQGGCCAG
ncbi:sulfite exporter TauE/SafE [Anaerobacterium chartisolvens]|uniref:Sulfite exporter TauE/SafE n=1 Tax=Anaerobacterium chartisolvens TaxID=1297424 RepID=A0A369AQ88_9FIRM|nr:sulfite exporter TauE/SafE family protein [Anaerobacterium chartisolvens]RCX10367.1 sulfite exporter TauE/SafE [Anaerobacterium chartisolvens]